MQQHINILTDAQKKVWIEAASTFPENQLDSIIQRTLLDLPREQNQSNYYEIRRFDIPLAFDTLLKLQNTGAAHRHIEVTENEHREVLRIEATLLDLIMQAIALLLDVFLKITTGALKGNPDALKNQQKSNLTSEPYIPSWKKQPWIAHDDENGYTR
ncbi:hypothetical protein ACF8MH_00950 [Pseudomonas sp. YQ_13]|uniref:hypothetical protein n=1 Tax=Pseudomonas sp. YQ_13 TaxID=3367235 RepID=UPI00370CF5E9